MKIQRILASLVLTIFIFGHALSLPAFAEDAPSAPTPIPAPTAEAAPQNTAQKSEPESAPTPLPTVTLDDLKKEEAKKEDIKREEDKKKKEDKKSPAPSSSPSTSPAASSQPSSSSSTAQPSATPAPTGNQTGNQSNGGNVGPTTINTDTATNQAVVVTAGNTNAALTPGQSTGVANSGPSVGVVNTGNGATSTNDASSSVSNTNNTNQGNSASVVNDVNQTTVTGQNKANGNTGGDVNVTTGDANTTGTIINSLNTNVSGVSVAEFNVEDDHKGDIILDYATGCISNCLTGSVTAANTNNGKESTNAADVDVNNVNNTNQFNQADVSNNMTLAADSGHNKVNDNTNGDANITTGDANVAANVITLANNNVAGNIIYTTVNVFGDLVGDIIMPKDYIEDAGGCTTCGGGDLTAANSDNGKGSDNNANIDSTTANNTFQSNDANIENNLIVDASTADNQVSDNTNGDNNIKTGEVNVDANVLNVANSNVAGGVWWLVLVNEAGNWVGKIVGSPDGTNMAGSEGTEFIVNDQGEVIAVNSGNGSGSTNNTGIASNNTNNTVQDNKINLVNNVNLRANTGGNKANDNTGGNSKIKTGDANVVANIVNFVNNNITGGGKLFVTVVNVFGSWKGDFVTPDGQKQPHQGSAELAQASANPSPSIKPSASPKVLAAIDEEESDNSSSSNQGTTRVKRTKKTIAPATANEESTGNGSGGSSVSLGNSLAQVAGVKIGPNLEVPEGAIVGKEKIKINLAWLVLALPLLGLIALSRIRIAYYTRKLKNKLESKKVEGVLLGSLIAACLFLLNRAS